MGRRLHYFRGVPLGPVLVLILKASVLVGTIFCARNMILDAMESVSANAMGYFVVSISEILQFTTYSLGGMNELLNVVLSLDFTHFEMFFPAMKDAYNYVILPASVLVVILVLISQIFNALMADFMSEKKTDNLFHLILLSLLAVPLVAKIKEVYQYVILPVFGAVYDLAINFDVSTSSLLPAISGGRMSSGGITPQGIMESFSSVIDTSGSFYTTEGSDLPLGYANGQTFDYFREAGSGFDNVQALGYTFVGNGLSFLITIVSIIIFCRYLGFLFRVMERYVWVFVLGYFAPLGMSCIASVNTRPITSRYWSMIKSSLISLAISVIMVKVVSHGFLITFMSGGTFALADRYYSANPVIFKFVAAAMFLAILEITKKIDSTLNSLGLVNSGMSGGPENGLTSSLKFYGVMAARSLWHGISNIGRLHTRGQEKKALEARQSQRDNERKARQEALDNERKVKEAEREAAQTKEGGAAQTAFNDTMGGNTFDQTDQNGNPITTDDAAIKSMQDDLHTAMAETPQEAEDRFNGAMEEAYDPMQQINDAYTDWSNGIGTDAAVGEDSNLFKLDDTGERITNEDHFMNQIDQMCADMGFAKGDKEHGYTLNSTGMEVRDIAHEELAAAVARSAATGQPESLNDIFGRVESRVMDDPEHFGLRDASDYQSMYSDGSKAAWAEESENVPLMTKTENGFALNEDAKQYIEAAKNEQIDRLNLKPDGEAAETLGNFYDNTAREMVKKGDENASVADAIRSAEGFSTAVFSNYTQKADKLGAMDESIPQFESTLSHNGTDERDQFIKQANRTRVQNPDGSVNPDAKSLIDQSMKQQMANMNTQASMPEGVRISSMYQTAQRDLLAKNPNATAGDVIRAAEKGVHSISNYGPLTPDGTKERSDFIKKAGSTSFVDKKGQVNMEAYGMFDKALNQKLSVTGVNPSSPEGKRITSAYRQAQLEAMSSKNPNVTVADVIRSGERMASQRYRREDFRTNDTTAKDYKEYMRGSDIKKARDVMKRTYGFDNGQIDRAFESAGQNLYDRTRGIPSSTVLKQEAMRQADRMYHEERAAFARINTPERLDYARRPVDANATRYVPDVANGGFKDATAVVTRNDGTKDYMQVRPLYTISGDGTRKSYVSNREMADIERQCSQGDNFVTTNKNADGTTTVYGWTSKQKLDSKKRFDR